MRAGTSAARAESSGAAPYDAPTSDYDKFIKALEPWRSHQSIKGEQFANWLEAQHNPIRGWSSPQQHGGDQEEHWQG